jgi:hypothetical protein
MGYIPFGMPSKFLVMIRSNESIGLFHQTTHTFKYKEGQDTILNYLGHSDVLAKIKGSFKMNANPSMNEILLKWLYNPK